jgi:hypothetical protein
MANRGLTAEIVEDLALCLRHGEVVLKDWQWNLAQERGDSRNKYSALVSMLQAQSRLLASLAKEALSAPHEVFREKAGHPRVNQVCVERRYVDGLLSRCLSAWI